jgi:hypothetical protein
VLAVATKRPWYCLCCGLKDERKKKKIRYRKLEKINKFRYNLYLEAMVEEPNGSDTICYGVFLGLGIYLDFGDFDMDCGGIEKIRTR